MKTLLQKYSSDQLEHISHVMFIVGMFLMCAAICNLIAFSALAPDYVITAIIISFIAIMLCFMFWYLSYKIDTSWLYHEE